MKNFLHVPAFSGFAAFSRAKGTGRPVSRDPTFLTGQANCLAEEQEVSR
jgi:hypothetical protein